MSKRSDGQGITRRDMLLLLGVTPLIPAALQGGIAMAEEVAGRPLAYRGEHQPKPLPFDPVSYTHLTLPTILRV